MPEEELKIEREIYEARIPAHCKNWVDDLILSKNIWISANADATFIKPRA